jgi:DNA polymerase III delta prime subunit
MNKTEIAIIKNNINAQLENKEIAPLFISGAPGIAKTTTIKLIAEELDMNVSSISAPTLSSEVLTGLPDDYLEPKLDKYTVDGSKAIATRWSIPELIADANRLAESKPTILLLDDFHMIGSHLQSYFFKLLLERSIGNYKLSDNVVILGTMNSSEEAGFSNINSAVRNRMSILEVELNFEHWFESYGKRLHYLVASYLKAKPSKITEPESVDIEGYSTARSWSALSHELNYIDNDFIVNNAEKLCAMQHSKSAAKSFASHVAKVNAINFENIVSVRSIINIRNLSDPIASILYSYIVNFIYTVEDGIYLMELIDENIKDRTFIGFLMGELYTLYTQEDKNTDGIRLVIDKVLGTDADKKLYTNTSDAKFKKAEKYVFKNKDEVMDIASQYLI